MEGKQKIIPHLWFAREAEKAAQRYTSLFKHADVGEITRYSDVGYETHGMDAGSVQTVSFDLEGFEMIALNGGPKVRFNPSVSLFVNCSTPEEVDRLYEELSSGGDVLMPLDSYPFSQRFAWVKDSYGLSWQLVHTQEHFDQKIIPALMFTGENAGKAEKALRRYTEVFPDSSIGPIAYYGEGQEPEKPDHIMFSRFQLSGVQFIATDSSLDHSFSFNEAFSFLVPCSNQEEIDSYWEALSADPEAEQCGWLKDAYGLSWQIVPEILDDLLQDPDRDRADRVMERMLQMKRLDIGALEEA